MVRIFLQSLTCIVAMAPALVFSAEKSWQQAQDEKQLAQAGLPLDTKSLLDYIRQRSLTEAMQEQMAQNVTDLGHRSFRRREKAALHLTRIGRPALPFLQHALSLQDMEIVRRARRAKELIEERPCTEHMKAVIRVLAARRSREAPEVLLSYLPSVTDSQEREVILTALARTGLDDGKPLTAIDQGTKDPRPEKRAAAAYVLGKAIPLPRQQLFALLRDPEPVVRFRAAEALIRAREKAAVPALIDLIETMPDERCWQVEDALFQLARDQKAPGSLQSQDPSHRRAAAQQWQAWWVHNAAAIDLTRIDFDHPRRGYTLFCEYDGGPRGGCVWLAGRDGKPRWEVSGLLGPNDARLLPNGRILIAERNGNRVTERDRKGNILWEKRVEGGAIACQRLHNGNTLITTWSDVIEVERSGRVVWRFTHSRGMRYAYQARDRRILGISANGEVFFLSPKGKKMQAILPERYTRGAGYWASVEQLSNGHLLVALGSREKVVEIDQSGKIQWEVTVPNAVFATRLRDGNTLICNFEQRVVTRVNREGKEVSRSLLTGRPFVVRRY